MLDSAYSVRLAKEHLRAIDIVNMRVKRCTAALVYIVEVVADAPCWINAVSVHGKLTESTENTAVYLLFEVNIG